MADERGSGPKDGKDARPPVKAPVRLPSGGWSQVPDLPPPPAARPIREDAAPRTPQDAERSLGGDRIVPSEPEVAVNADPSALRNDPDWDADQEAFVKAAFDSRPPTVAADQQALQAMADGSADAGEAAPPRRTMKRPELPEPKGSTQMGYQGRAAADSELPSASASASESGLVDALDAYSPWQDEADGEASSAAPGQRSLDEVVESRSDVVELELDVDIMPVEGETIDANEISMEPLGANDGANDGADDGDEGVPELDDDAFVVDPPSTSVESRPSLASTEVAEPAGAQAPASSAPAESARQKQDTGPSPTAAILRPSTWFGGRRPKPSGSSERVDPARTAAAIAAAQANPSPVAETPSEPSAASASEAAEAAALSPPPVPEAALPDAEPAAPEREPRLSIDVEQVDEALADAPATDAGAAAEVDDAAPNHEAAAEHAGDATGDEAASASADAVPAPDVLAPGEGADFGASMRRPTSEVTVVPGLTEHPPRPEAPADEPDVVSIEAAIDDENALAALGELDAAIEADAAEMAPQQAVTAQPPGLEAVVGATPRATEALEVTVETESSDASHDVDASAADAVDATASDAPMADDGGDSDTDEDDAPAAQAPPVAAREAAVDPNEMSFLPTPERRPLSLHQPELAGGPPTGRHNWVTRQDLFETQKRGLTNTRRWDQLAAVTAYAAVHADWAVGPARVALLLDLSRLYRTRLDAPEHAEEALVALTVEQPGHAEAVEWLVERYVARGDARRAVQLHRDAIEGTWDPDERRHHAVEAARIAVDILDEPALAADAWGGLLRVGDGGDEAERELTRNLRLVGAHGRLGDFVLERAADLEGAERRRVLREAAALYDAAGRSDDAIAALRSLLGDRPDDPVATHRLSRLLADAERWDDLEALGGDLADADGTDAVTRERAHRVAAALEAAGRRDRAASIWQWLVSTDSEDREAAERLRSNLRAVGAWTDLVSALAAASDATAETSDEIALVSEAAAIAETHLEDVHHALMLVRRRIRLEGPTVEGMQALERLARASGDSDTVREALVAQRDLSTTAAERADVLRRLARHDADERGDDEAARDALREVLRLDASDAEARDQLVAIHERRGDHEALDSALVRQLAVTTDPDARQAIALRAARNVDASFDDPDRSVAAWRRVLDGAPRDPDALATLADHEAKRGHSRVARFLRELRIAELDEAAAADAWTALADAHRDAGDLVLAAAALERVIALDPSRDEAWQALADAWLAADQRAAALAVLDDAARHADPSDRPRWIGALLGILPEDARDARWAALHRLWQLGALGDDERVELMNPPPSRVADLLAMLACEVVAAGGAARETARAALVGALETRIGDPARALAVHVAGLLDADRLAAGAETAARLAAAADRAEFELAMLDRRAELATDAAAAQGLRLEAAKHANERCGSPRRAFARLRALAFAEDTPDARLDDLRTLADAAGLHGALVETLVELADRSTDAAQVAAYLDEVRRLRAVHLDDAGGAFAIACRQLRSRDAGATADGLLDAAAPLHLDAVALAISEAVRGDAATSPDRLAETWRGIDAAERGFEHAAMAFFAAPSDDDAREALAKAAEAANVWSRYAGALRHGAALADTPERSMSLLEQTASVFVERLDDHEGSVAIHRQLLSLHPDATHSLDVLIEDDRQRERWWDLRDRLQRRARLSDDEAVAHAALREIADLSEHQLDDDETALRTWRRIVEANPDDADARQRLMAILNRVDDPALRLEARRLDAAHASGAASIEILLDIARIERDELDDADAAVATLEAAIDTHGVDNAASVALVNLYDECARAADATRLLLREADEATSNDVRLRFLDRVVERVETAPGQLDDETWTRVLATIVEHRPDDATARRRLASDRFAAGDLAGWSEAVAPLASTDGDAVARTWAMLHARVLAHELDEPVDALARFAAVGRHPALRSLDLLARAAVTEDVEARAALWTEWAETLEAPQRALVLCALAESAEERDVPVTELAALYRDARSLDPGCAPAMEALKGIGRRVRQLRPAAALLPEEGERNRAPHERADRLIERFDADGDPEWLRRAVAMAPDHIAAWDRLAAFGARTGDRVAAARARVEGWLARCRTRSLSADDATALELAARALDVLGHHDLSDAWLAAAHHLDPARPDAAAVVAERALAQGQADEARRTLDRVFAALDDDVAPALRARLLVARGRARTALGDGSATGDYHAAIEIAPTSPDALDALARSSCDTRPVEALDLWITALAVDPRPDVRAERLLDVGRGFEDALADVDEAGPWYVAAHDLGLDDRDLMHRVFRHYQRIGRLAHGLDVVDRLLESATEADELATLWIARGHILADQGGDTAAADAIEAFDMALSYDPGRNDARHGLVRVLEAAGEWAQLAQVLEAIADGSEGHDRAMAMLRMADVVERIPNPTHSIEDLLERSIEADPVPEALRRLEAIHAERDPSGERRLELLGLLVAAGPPWYEPAVEMGRLLLDIEPRRAWCTLSPSLMIRATDDDLKGRLRDMRREYERPPLLLARLEPTFDDRAVAALHQALVAAGDRPLASSSDAEIADRSEVSIHSNIGRTFAAMATRLGLPSVSLYRATIDEPVRVMANEDHVDVIVRADVFQQMARAEIGFVLRYAFALLEPGARALFTVEPRDRRHLVDAVLAACEVSESGGEQVARFAEAIGDALSDEVRTQVASALEGDERGSGALARALEAALRRHARRLSLIAGADIYQIARLLARMNDGVPSPGVYATADQFDEYLADAPALADLVVFAASEIFATALASADEISP